MVLLGVKTTNEMSENYSNKICMLKITQKKEKKQLYLKYSRYVLLNKAKIDKMHF